MIIDQICAPITGGAAIAARRLHDELVRSGFDSRFWYVPKKGQPSPNASYRPIDGTRHAKSENWLTYRLRRLAAKRATKRDLGGRPKGLELFSNPAAGLRIRHSNDHFQGDIAHLHWFGNKLDYPHLIASMPDDLPIVWTLHDMNAMTGGCHYSGQCQAYQTSCRRCPQLGRPGDHDVSARCFSFKAQAFAGKQFHVVAVGKHLEHQAKQSALFANATSFQTIHCGLDIQLLRPHDRQECRAQYQLPNNAFVIGFGANTLDNHRKGLRELAGAFDQLKTDHEVIGLVFGNGEIPTDCLGRVRLRNAGYLTDWSELARMYSALDAFAMPSLEEAFGMTGLEAMACGTPVVGFRAGGIVDYVREDITGKLADVGNINQLAQQIDWLIDEPDARQEMGHRARKMVEDEFESSRQAHKYQELYQSIVNQRNLTARSAA